MAITRTAMVDDDGSGTTGTIINNAWKTELYNQIDAALTASWVVAAYTPVDASGAGLAFPVARGEYMKSGPLVFVAVDVSYPTTANGSVSAISLPLPAVGLVAHFSGAVGLSTQGSPLTVAVIVGASHVAVVTFTGAQVTNAQLSGAILRFSAVYRTTP